MPEPVQKVTLHEGRVEGYQVFTIWIMRIGFVAILSELLFFAADLSDEDWTILILQPLVLVALIVGSEYVYFKLKSRVAQADVTREGVELSAPSLYFGRRVGKPRTIRKDEVDSVEIVRSVDSPQTAWAKPPVGGWPVALSIQRKDGKASNLAGRRPEEVLRASDMMRGWGVQVLDRSSQAPKPRKVYGEFVNNHHDNRHLFIIGLTVSMGAMLSYFIYSFLQHEGPTFEKVLVIGMLGGLLVFLVVMSALTYKTCKITKVVVVSPDGLQLKSRNKTKTVPWGDLREVSFPPLDQVEKSKNRVAMLKVGKRNSYIVTEEIGRAVEMAYGTSKGMDRPFSPASPPKPGRLTPVEASNLKYQNPRLYRKMIYISAALFVTSFLFIFAIITGFFFFTIIGIIIVIVLVFMQMQTRREIAKWTEAERSRKG